uniref:Galectin n=1 Tax=Astatotilapia calliptera TaxID=8154 RepID=A0AAX7SVD4_ASTCA
TALSSAVSPKIPVFICTGYDNKEHDLQGRTNPDCCWSHQIWFVVDIGESEDRIAFHFNPRFDDSRHINIIVCNSFEGGNWHQEQYEKSFPFSPGKEFKISIQFTCSEFVVTLSNGSTFCFPNRMGAEKYSVMGFHGDAVIRSIEIK